MKPSYSLTADVATSLVAAAIAEADRRAIRICVAVVDLSGLLFQLHRMEGAPALSSVIAAGKARAAALTGYPTSVMEMVGKANPGLLSFGEYVAVGGACPIRFNECLVGAIAISGGSAEEDEQIANVALEAANLA